MTKNYNILLNLTQAIKKLKKTVKLFSINKKNTLLLEFLWLNHFIYGFSKTNNIKSIIIFLKYNKLNNNLKITKLLQNRNNKNLQKEYKWSKNSFFILKTSNGLLNIKTTLISKIGGFLLYKLF